MKFTLVPIIAMAATAKAMFDTETVGGYATSCKHMALVEQNKHTGLRAECQVGGNATQCSILDLNDCFGMNEIRRNLQPIDKYVDAHYYV